MPTLRGEVTKPQVRIQPDRFTLSDQNGRLLSKVSTLTAASIRTLRKDPTISLVRELSVAPVLSSPWSVESKPDTPSGAREFIEEQMMPVRIHLVQKGFYGSIDFGFAPFEKVFFVNKDGFQSIGKYKPLLQDFTEILVTRQNGRFAGFKQTVEGIEQILSLRKSLNLNLEVEGTDWYGLSVMDKVGDTQTNWNNVNDAANRFDKKIAGAHWVIHYPDGVSSVDGTETANDVVASSILTSLQASGGVIVPNRVTEFIEDVNKDAPLAWRIELISPGGNIQNTFIDRLKYLDALKVRAFGFPERAILEGQFGTKAEAGVHVDLAMVNAEVKHAIIVQQINFHVVNQLLRINFGQEAENSVWIKPAPIIDSRLGLIKEIYSRILQNADTLVSEYNKLDMESVRKELGLPDDPETSDLQSVILPEFEGSNTDG